MAFLFMGACSLSPLSLCLSGLSTAVGLQQVSTAAEEKKRKRELDDLAAESQRLLRGKVWSVA